MNKNNFRTFSLVVGGVIALNILSAFIFFRLDLTSDKRYTISENTKKLMSGLDKRMHIKIYLDGDLNPSFLQLKKATVELLDEFKVYSNNDFTYEFINPSAAGTQEERNKNYIALERRGMRAFTINEKDDEGKLIQKIVFPWAEIVYGKDTFNINLLQNNPYFKDNQNITPEQILNNSIENLEFEFTDAIRVKTIKNKPKIAFIEGHNEFPEELVFDAEISLQRYFDVKRGQLGNNLDALKDFKAIVIAKPLTKFSEQDKFIIDQYIMNGGRVLWLIDGIRMAMDSLSTAGVSPVIPLDVNLDDQLFKYGIRMVPAILEDMQCIQIPMNVARRDEESKFEPMPWYYSPLLIPLNDHPVSRNITEVKAEFASALDLNVSKNPDIKKIPLLITSNASHVEMTPTRIDLKSMYNMDSKTYFNMAYIPVAAIIEGQFPSVFTNRLAPEGINFSGKIKNKSVPTRMVFVADGDIIRNDIQGSGKNMQLIPMGYDRYTQREYGNRAFILNSMLYLADDDGWLQLRSREFKLRLLNKREVVESKKTWQIINVLLPLISLLIFGLAYTIVRRKRYTDSKLKN